MVVLLSYIVLYTLQIHLVAFKGVEKLCVWLVKSQDYFYKKVNLDQKSSQKLT